MFNNLGLLLLLGAGGSATAQAQIAPRNPIAAQAQSAAQAQIAADGPAMLTAPNGNKTPIFWADGITALTELDAYRAQGLNTVVVRLTWTPREDGEISALDLAPQRAFAEQAARRGLAVIYALPAAPTGLDTSFRLAADSDAYLSLWTTWLQDAVASLRTTPHLIGWMLPDDPRGLSLFDDTGWQNWLSQNYAGIDVLNTQWQTKYASFDDVSMLEADQQIAAWRGDAAATEAELNASSTYTRRQVGANWAFHPASLALANYKWDAYRALLTAWVGAVRGEDATHLVFSGQMPDYAQLLSLPSGIDIAVPDLAPNVAEDDMVTHNPQSIDIARRGGKFEVIPMLSPRARPDWPTSALPDLCRRWIGEAAARGARGVSFDSWRVLRDSAGLSSAVKEEINRLVLPPFAATWGQPPINTTAVLLSPLAEGSVAQIGAPPNQSERGLYGFGENLVSGEPGDLVWMLRWGTAFGGIDYLSPDDLGDATIARYATILAPQALSTSAETTSQLVDYVANGGVLLADLGLGAQQNGGQVSGLSPAFVNLFGVPGSYEMRPLTFNLSGIASHPLFPSWSHSIDIRRGLMLTMGDGPSQSAFAGPVGFSPLPPTAEVLATAPRLPQNLGRIKRILSAPLTVNAVEHGYALFAPFRLWTNWHSGQQGFDAFFGDLFSRGATIALPSAASLVPSPIGAGLGETRFCEVVNRASGLSLTNHNAPNQAAQLTDIETSSVGDWLWNGGIVHLITRSDSPTVGGRRAPIDTASEFENRQRPVALYASVAPGQSQVLSMRPIAAQNLAGGTLAAQINEENGRSLKLSFWPNPPAITPGETDWQPAFGTAAPVRLTVVSSDDGYNFAPASRHRVHITDYGKPVGKKGAFATVDKVVVADASGRLTVEFTGVACAVEIAPVG